MALDDLLANPDHWRDAAKDVIDHASIKVVAPILGTVNQQGASIVAALRDGLDRLDRMLKPLNEFIASVSVKAGK